MQCIMRISQLSKKCQSCSRSTLFSVRFCSSNCTLYNVESDPAIELNSSNALNSSVCSHVGFENRPRRIPTPVRYSSEIEERLRYYSATLRFCASKGSLNEGKAVHGQLIKSGIDPDLHLWNSLVNVYAKCGSFGYARNVFDDMPERDVVSWTALIAGLVNDGYGSDGLSLLCNMRKDSIRPDDFTLATALKACSMCLDIEFGRQLHVEVIRLGVSTDIYVGSALVDLYAKCGEMEFAETVFLCIPEKNDVSWNALLNGYAEMGDGREVLRLFCSMSEAEMKFSKFTLANVLKGCANSGYLRESQVVHTLAVRIGYELDEFFGCCLLDMYTNFGLADDALKVFKRIKDPNVVVAWSAIIKCMDQNGDSEEAAKLFCLMRHRGVEPNNFTVASLVRAATSLCDQPYGESIHAFAYKCGFASDNFVISALIAMYMKAELIQNGWRVFDTMMVQDSASWNALLIGFQDNNTCDQGPRIFKQMLVEGLKPDMYTYVGILGSCSTLSDAAFGKQVHAHIIKNGRDGDGFVGRELFNMYAQSSCLEDAGVIFNRLIERDLVTWAVIIAGYAQADQGEKAVLCFNQMQQEGLKPNQFTLSSCLSGCSSSATLENGRQLHSLAIKAGLSDNTYVVSALLDMYGKCRGIEDAEAVFEGIGLPSIVSWNSIICGYSQHGQGEKALRAFGSMLDEGIMPDRVTFIGVLSACSHLGLPEEGKILFNSLSNVYGITPTIEHYNCIVNMLCWEGKFSEVEYFIEEMKLIQNASIWKTVLWACKMHGNIELAQRAAKKLFELEPGKAYNYILLSHICAAKGKWDDVVKIRESMSVQGIIKEPGCSRVEVDGQTHVFYAQDNSHPKIKEIHLQLQELTR